MDKKILLGSIIAVVILVLVSFTGVVGYQTTKSSTIVRASPLFSVRSKRAIDKESKDLTCDYVGKGKRTLFTFPKRNDKMTLVEKVTDGFREMDDETFKQFITLTINKLRENNKIGEKYIPNIVESLSEIRKNPEILKVLLTYENDKQNIISLDACFPTMSCILTIFLPNICWDIWTLILILIIGIFAGPYLFLMWLAFDCAPYGTFGLTFVTGCNSE